MSWLFVVKLFTDGPRIPRQRYDLKSVGMFGVPGSDWWEYFVAGGKLVGALSRSQRG